MAKSSATSARGKARKMMLELVKQRAERDARVQAQVEQFYVAADAVEAAAEKLAAAQAAHEQAQTDAREAQAMVVQALFAEQMSESEIASLCGISVVQVRSLRRLASSLTPPAAADGGAGGKETAGGNDADASDAVSPTPSASASTDV